MIKGLRQIPLYAKSESIYVRYPKPNMLNTHGVPASKWCKWTPEAREMFNYLYKSSMNNHKAVFGTDKFKCSEDMDKIIAAASWNIAWMAADKLSVR